MASSSMPGGILRRSDSVADMMPEALRQSRYQMKRCFQRYHK
jgi:sucrose synthase